MITDKLIEHSDYFPYLIVIFILVFFYSIIKKRGKLGNLKLGTRKKACGIIFGMVLTWKGPRVVYSPINDEGSVFVWGTSGSGKTDGILRPTINSLSGVATTFCIDISGDIASTIHLPNMIVFGPSAEKSAVYNVFAPVDKIRRNRKIKDENEKNDLIIEQLQKIASQMLPTMENGEGSDGTVFFNNGGNAVIASSLIAGYFNKLDFADICDKIFKNSWQQHFTWIDSLKCEPASDLLGQFEGIKDEWKASCMGEAKKAVKCIASSSKIKKFLHRPRKLKNGKLEPYYTPRMLETHSIFYVVEDGMPFNLYAPLTRLVVSQTMEYLESRKVEKTTHTILLTLDEFSSLKLAKETAAAAKKYRKKHVRLFVLTQSIADMDLMTNQGNTASRATIDNFPYRIVLAVQDPTSQKYFADCVGKHDIYHKDSHGNKISRPDRVYWIEPEDFGRLDKHLVVVHPKGHMILGKNYYHQWSIGIIFKSLLDGSIFKWRMR